MLPPQRILQTTRGALQLGGRVWLMGIVNATPDSFSDTGESSTVQARIELAAELLEAGADVIDIGGESGVTNRPAVAVQEEIERVVPVIEGVVGQLGAVVSVDTYKPAVAEAAVAAGAAIVNDVSALHDPALADVCARTGAGLILMHTRAAPKVRFHDAEMDGRMAADVHALLAELIDRAIRGGVRREQLMIDPGPDFAKTPFQSVEVMRAVSHLHEFELPILAAISRKDFIGAINQRRPRERLAGTLAALSYIADSGLHMARIHDVEAAADFLAVREVLAGRAEVQPQLRLGDELRWHRPKQP